MLSLLHIGEAIEKRVIERHAETITRFLDILENSLENYDEAFKQCSYEAHLAYYIQTKLKARYLERDLEDQVNLPVLRPYELTDDQYDKIRERISTLSYRVEDYRKMMYKNVCGECASCRTRRKSWPAGTHIKNSNVITIKSGMKLVLQSLEKPNQYVVHMIAGDQDGQTSDPSQ